MIDRVTLWRYSIPLSAPLILKNDRLQARKGLLLQWEYSDDSGTRLAPEWSEIAPLSGFSHETLGAAEQQLVTFFERYSIADIRLSVQQWADDIAQADVYPSVRFGLEMGLSKLVEHLEPVYKRKQTRHLPIAGLITDDLTDPHYYNAMPSIKVKVGRGSIEQDIGRITHILAKLKPTQRLRLDANQSWSFEQTQQFLASLPADRIEFIEEPLSTIEDYSLWASHITVPFALDEQVQEVDFIVKPLAGLGAIVIKPMLIGLSRALLLAKQAEQLGIGVVISSSYESSLTLNFLYDLACRLPCSLSPGLDTASLFKYSLMEPLALPTLQQHVPLISSPRADSNQSILYCIEKVACYGA